MKILKNGLFWRIFLVVIVGLSILFIWLRAWNYLPVATTETGSNGYICTKAHIYLQWRLKFLGCRTVTGKIEAIKHEPDGDYHALLRVDPQYQLLLSQANYTQKNGDMIIEDVCFYPSPDRFAKESCENYKSPFSPPAVGKRYEITGNYVLDRVHGDWAEVHGLSELKEIR